MAERVEVVIEEVPPGEWRERVLAMANTAKHIAYHGGGGPMPPDHVFIRAALTVDVLLRRDGHMTAALLTCLTAGQFFAGIDYESGLRADILRETLHDPVAELARAVANNRRLLGMPPQLDLAGPQGGDR